MTGRIVAVICVIGLLIGAFAWRERSDESGGSGSETLRLVCVSEAASACEALAKQSKNRLTTTVEPAATTASALSADTSTDIDGWIAPPAWIEMVRSARQRASIGEGLREPSRSVARSPVVLVVDRARAGVMRSNCKGDIDWKCLGDVMGKGRWDALPGGRTEWGQTNFGWSDPATSATGLATLAGMTAGYFGRSDVDAFDLDDTAYSQWITATTRSIARGSSNPLTTMLTSGPATFNGVVTTESAAAPLLATAARASEFETVYLNPRTTLDLSYAAVGKSGRLSGFVEGSQDEFADASWRLPGKATTDALRNDAGMPESDGLLSAGAMERLRSKWQQELSR